MSFHPLVSILASSVCFLLAIFIAFRSGFSAIRRSFACVTMLIAIWSTSPFVSSLSFEKDILLVILRSIYISAIFVPTGFFIFMSQLLDLGQHKTTRTILISSFFVSLIFLSISLSPLFIRDLRVNHYGFGIIPGTFYPFFIAYFAFMYFFASIKLLERYISAKEARKNQLLYIGVAFTMAFVSGLIHFLASYGVSEVFPHDILVAAYSLLMAYAIVKFRLLDISVAFTKLGVFLIVYTLVLGIPFIIGFKYPDRWLLPVTTMAVLATVGPFVYLYLQKRIEERLLQEQRRYQATLRQASAGMGRIRDLKKLLNLIVFILARVVRLDHAMIYFIDRNIGEFRLAASRRMRQQGVLRATLDPMSPVVKYFSSVSLPLVRDEVNQRSRQERDAGFVAIETAMEELDAEVIFPIYIRTNIVAIVLMGKKFNGRNYTEDDLNVFSILSNQASLAIENALSYEDMKKTQEKLFKAEKMATIGTMADGLSHQINNRLHAMGFIASDMLDTLKLRRDFFSTDELKPLLKEFEHSLFRIQDNVMRGGEIVQGLMRYTRKGEEGFAAYSIDDIIRSSYEMAQFKISSFEFKLKKAFDPAAISRVRGNFTQLQEVFFNLIDNAYDATVQRKAELKEPNYLGELTVHVSEINGLLEIIFSDNGIGIKSTDMEKLFTPFFTTKATTKKGTGLGLYVIRKIIEDNHGGKVEMNSTYGQGTKITIYLTASKG
ncbi:MAG: ATP-binding protein [Candidatus Omnitrophota bacterium]